jgi:hypothetical protein
MEKAWHFIAEWPAQRSNGALNGLRNFKEGRGGKKSGLVMLNAYLTPFHPSSCKSSLYFIYSTLLPHLSCLPLPLLFLTQLVSHYCPKCLLPPYKEFNFPFSASTTPLYIIDVIALDS